MSVIKFTSIAFVVMLIIGSYVAFNSSSFLLHVGKEHFYSYITQETESITNSNKYHYIYHLLSMNSNGNQRVLTLKTAEALHNRSYIQLYVNKDGQVTDWDEIRPESLPRSISSFLR